MDLTNIIFDNGIILNISLLNLQFAFVYYFHHNFRLRPLSIFFSLRVKHYLIICTGVTTLYY